MDMIRSIIQHVHWSNPALTNNNQNVNKINCELAWATSTLPSIAVAARNGTFQWLVFLSFASINPNFRTISFPPDLIVRRILVLIYILNWRVLWIETNFRSSSLKIFSLPAGNSFNVFLSLFLVDSKRDCRRTCILMCVCVCVIYYPPMNRICQFQQCARCTFINYYRIAICFFYLLCFIHRTDLLFLQSRKMLTHWHCIRNVQLQFLQYCETSAHTKLTAKSHVQSLLNPDGISCAFSVHLYWWSGWCCLCVRRGGKRFVLFPFILFTLLTHTQNRSYSFTETLTADLINKLLLPDADGALAPS